MDSLVSTEWLASNLGATDLVVLDASRHLPAAERDARAEFSTAHIPGARFFDLAALVDDTSDVPQALPRPEQLAIELARCGAGPASRIVFYDDSAVKTAARAWFLCRAHGLNNVAILDGGLAKWKAEGRALESGEPQVQRAQPFSLPAPDRIRFKRDMMENLNSCAEQVLDARDAGRFTGTTVDTIHGQPTGHIPGSCNLPFGQLFREDGTYKSPDELRNALADAGIDADRPIVTTCGSGVTACVLLFALHLTGREDTALYDGSWLDWGSDPATPKATVSL
ncbi:sulfurtransferase [Altererythrobacter litoralis]|uniref:Sulfurtransferase n=1 Tax=Altererythrobacter litoralis TaxID=3113904 RepID=A0ABU7GDY5_9SPHN|nr:sulfurtransferase [Erythrobacteraceae bacterium 1XM1-14]